MSVKALSHVWEFSKQKGARLLVMLALADNADDDGFSWYSMVKLAKKARQDADATRDYIRDVETDGELIVYERKTDDGKTNHSNLYQVVMPGASSQLPDIRGDMKRRLPLSEKRKRQRNTPLVENGGTGENHPPPTGENHPPPTGENHQSDPLIVPPIEPSVKSIAPSGATTLSLFPSEENDPPANNDSLQANDPIPNITGGRRDLLDRLNDDEDDSWLYPTATANDIGAMIAAWVNWTPCLPTKLGKAIPVNDHYRNKSNRALAAALFERGVRPADYVECLGQLRDNDRYKHREMNFDYASKIVVEWAHTAHEDSDYSRAAPRVVPRKPGIRVEYDFSGDDLFASLQANESLYVDVPLPIREPVSE